MKRSSFIVAAVLFAGTGYSASLKPLDWPEALEPASKDIRIRLKPAELEHPERLPLVVTHRLTDSLPKVWFSEPRAVEIKGKKLAIDTTGDGKCNKKVSQTRPKCLEFDDQRTLVIYHHRLGWHAGPGALLRGKSAGFEIEFLDGDLDGDFFGEEDWVRFAGGSFQRQTSAKRVSDGTAIWTYQVEEKKRKVNLLLKQEAVPDGINDLQWDALLSANHFRNRVGLPPLHLDPKRSKACQSHAAYLYENNYDYTKPWDGVGSHDQKPGNKGYTPEGREAAHRSTTSGQADAAESILTQTLTMLHRTNFIGPPEEGLGVGAVSGSKNTADGYSVLWGGDPVLPPTALPVLVPAPGQQDVPRNGKR